MKVGLTRVDGKLRTFLVRSPQEAVVLAHGAPAPDDVVRDPEARHALAELEAGGTPTGLDTLDIVAPLRRFNRDILCTGWNYWDHFYESKGRREGQDPVAAPEHPTFFTRGPLSTAGPYDAIPIDPALSIQVDFEAELALVIGRGGRSIPEERAAEHIVGALVANDVSQRDIQRAHGGQWMKGKSIDGTMPLGPWLTTWDEVVDAGPLRIELELNGELMQSATTAEMAFPISRIIAELSRGMTLLPGDVILTGTPSGIGNARTPQVFLKADDVIVTRVGELGELRNRIVAADLTSYHPS
jgi:2-keto-4-pentenoate hydratase/2-oxohepta-3-ene-1,7-dioic acid hydratase in catechol pathway